MSISTSIRGNSPQPGWSIGPIRHIGNDVVYRVLTVSRGLGLVQAEVLRFFESRGLHIPDLVAIDGESTGLIVEIDAQFGRAEPSLQQYREHAADIMQAVSTFAPSAVRNLLLAFCQIGSVRDSRRYFSSKLIDLLYFFPQPFAPSCVRRG